MDLPTSKLAFQHSISKYSPPIINMHKADCHFVLWCTREIKCFFLGKKGTPSIMIHRHQAFEVSSMQPEGVKMLEFEDKTRFGRNDFWSPNRLC